MTEQRGSKATYKCARCGDPFTARTADRKRRGEPVQGESFARAWINLDALPGGMMVGPEGRFGPIPASTSCWITTSEREVERLRAKGPVLEVWLAPQSAEPVNVPSDAEIDDLWGLHEDSRTFARALLAERDVLHSIVEELVACDDLKKRIALTQQACIPESDEDFAEMDSLSGDLAKRNPVAWSAARAALAQHQGEKSDDQ
ncbi:hypothetical protein [Aquamicrobium sp.]|uniref:hypothetical protein n=1 Tax=Aquamicrobium sp. TaxID=1872579 RepID=UPI00258D6C48|nr:hypothetical protein [Aquamicrobium sp.]MCK9554151.1 hypothetical protein [Aquamicrobium sp.]